MQRMLTVELPGQSSSEEGHAKGWGDRIGCKKQGGDGGRSNVGTLLKGTAERRRGRRM